MKDFREIGGNGREVYLMFWIGELPVRPPVIPRAALIPYAKQDPSSKLLWRATFFLME